MAQATPAWYTEREIVVGTAPSVNCLTKDKKMISNLQS